MRVQSLGREDPLEKEMTTPYSILAWRSHGQRSLVGYGGLWSIMSQRVRHNLATEQQFPDPKLGKISTLLCSVAHPDPSLKATLPVGTLSVLWQ